MGNSLRIAMAFVLAAAGAVAQQSSQQSAFSAHCAGCHGADAEGTGKAPALAMNPRVAEQSAEQLRASRDHGHGSTQSGLAASTAGRLADLQRQRVRQSIQSAEPDQYNKRRRVEAE